MQNETVNPKQKNQISRRDFARHAALAAAGAAVLPATSLASATEKSLPPVEAPAQSSANKLSPASQAEVDARLEVIFNKYGSRLNDTQKSDLRRLAAEGQKPLDAIRAYSVGNSNQPVTVLKLYPEASALQSPENSKSAASPAKKD